MKNKQYNGVKKWANENNITYQQAEYCLDIISKVEDIIILKK